LTYNRKNMYRISHLQAGQTREEHNGKRFEENDWQQKYPRAILLKILHEKNRTN